MWLFIFIYIHRQWNRTVYHGEDKDVSGLRRYRPDAVPVETRLLPASSRFTTVFDSLPGYSRWIPVVLNILNNRDMGRFNTVHPGSPRLSTVPPRLCHGSSQFIPDHQTGMNRDEPCHNRGGTVDNLGDPGGTVLNRLMSSVVLKCLKQPALTGSNREGCQIPW